MSTYRKRTQAKPTTAAGLRAQASANGSSIFGNRPRSISGLFSLNQNNYQNNYSSLLGINNLNPYGTSNFLNNTAKNSGSVRKNSYSNSTNSLNYQNPYTTYGGTASGYGSVTLPVHSSNTSLNSLSTPSTSYNYLNLSSNPNNKAQVHRTSSLSKRKAKPDINISSRSSSLQSLTGSEGYVVRYLSNCQS